MDTNQYLLNSFGTATPTRKQVEAGIANIDEVISLMTRENRFYTPYTKRKRILENYLKTLPQPETFPTLGPLDILYKTILTELLEWKLINMTDKETMAQNITTAVSSEEMKPILKEILSYE